MDLNFWKKYFSSSSRIFLKNFIFCPKFENPILNWKDSTHRLLMGFYYLEKWKITMVGTRPGTTLDFIPATTPVHFTLPVANGWGTFLDRPRKHWIFTLGQNLLLRGSFIKLLGPFFVIVMFLFFRVKVKTSISRLFIDYTKVVLWTPHKKYTSAIISIIALLQWHSKLALGTTQYVVLVHY